MTLLSDHNIATAVFAAADRFSEQYPILACFQDINEDLLLTEQVGPTAEDTYRAYVARISTRGLVVDVDFRNPEGRTFLALSPAHLATLERMPAVGGVDELVIVKFAIELAARLPVSALPSSADGVWRLSIAGAAVRDLEEEFDPDEAIGSGYGFGLTFSESEMAALFRNVVFDSPLDVFSDWSRKARYLAAYGICLAGRTDLIKTYDGVDCKSEGEAGSAGRFDSDFAALKEAMLRDGIGETIRGASKVVAGFVANNKRHDQPSASL
ncbi:hypothetical protein ACVIGB_000991 [Bradyrhizobium sp. USDA 4341]